MKDGERPGRPYGYNDCRQWISPLPLSVRDSEAWAFSIWALIVYGKALKPA